ncbi:MAG: hypothetical protein EB160_04745, partial [Nitrososphaeria archaeon]|nr:hypothetical protein [Nitrososphaeria archaeon]
MEKYGQKDALAKEPLSIHSTSLPKKQALSFPGKISISKSGKIAVSDSNHNRILVTDTSGNVLHIVGSGKTGLVDGNFTIAQFFRPQGVVWNDDVLIVADT